MEKKKQHTVPRSYLENFADEKGMVWVLAEEASSKKVFKSAPKNLLTGNHFYTIEFNKGGMPFIIEDTLANIEGRFATIFREKISQELPLTLEERACVSIFVGTLLFRTKKIRESMRQGFVSLERQMEEWRKQFEVMSPKAREAASKISTPTNGQSFTQDDVKSAIENIDDIHSSMLIENLPEIASLIFDMGWGVITPEDSSDEFITSDHPVSMLRPDSIRKYGPDAFGSIPGLIYKDVEISLPLSPKLVLFMGWQIQESNQYYVPMPSSFVEQLNLRTIIQSREKIVASSERQINKIKGWIQELERQYPRKSESSD